LKLWSILAIRLLSRLKEGETTKPDPTQVRRWPGVQRQQFCDDGIAGIAWEQRATGPTPGVGDACQSNHSYGLLLPLVVHEEESLVFNDRSAQRASILVVVERRLRIWGPVYVLDWVDNFARLARYCEVLSRRP
jgi:hypothetical protein